MLFIRSIASVILCGGLVHEAAAQGFNRRFDPWGAGLAQWGWSLEIKADGGALIFSNTAWQDTLFYSSVLGCLNIDPAGEFVDTTRFAIPLHASYVGWSNASALRTQGGYVIGGNTYVADGTSKASLFFVDDEGVPEGYLEYGADGEEWIGRQAKQTPDGGYVLCGETSTSGVIDAFCVKTDSQGEVEWLRTYGAPTRMDFLYSVDLAPWGGYYLGGTREVGANTYDPWMVRVDDQGFMIGEGNYGTSNNDYSTAMVTTAANGDALAASAWNIGGSQSQQRVCLFRTNSAGTVLWSRRYGLLANTLLMVVQEVEPDGGLIATGFVYDGPYAKGLLLRTTAEGDSLWMRNYVYYDSVVQIGQGALYDVQPTPDGGFIAAGVALSIPGEYSQDVWVIKTDSMGCIEPGCHLIQGMETQVTNLRDVLAVAPNPVASGGNVQVSIHLPQSFTSQGSLRLTVVSSDGHLVYEQRVADASASQHIDALLSSGLYHIHLSDATRWISGAKLVVE